MSRQMGWKEDAPPVRIQVHGTRWWTIQVQAVQVPAWQFTRTHLAKFRVGPGRIVHPACLLSLGVPACRTGSSMGMNLSTVQHAFRVFRGAVCDNAIAGAVLSGEIETDGAVFGGHRSGKFGRGAEGRVVAFGTYQRNGHVMTFPVPDRERKTLMEPIEKHAKRGPLYYADDHTAYATLDTGGAHRTVSHGMDECVRLLVRSGVSNLFGSCLQSDTRAWST